MANEAFLPADLIDRVMDATKMAYAPYSNFKVGAILEDSEGRFHEGCNVENASYGLGICAERTAVVKAVSQGSKQFKRVIVHAETGHFCWPCGACRQVLNEFGPDMEVVSVNKHKAVASINLSALLPHSFGPETLESAKN